MNVDAILIIVAMITVTGFGTLAALTFVARRDALLLRREMDRHRF